MLGAIIGAVVAAGVSDVVESAAFGVAGGISTYMEGQRELKAADEHMKRMEMNQQLLLQRPNDYIQIRVSHNGMLGQYYVDVIKNLAGMGFYDINLNSVYEKKGLFDKERRGLVNMIFINGNAGFDEFSVFPRDSHVVVNAIVHDKSDFLTMHELGNIRNGAILYQRPVRRCQYCSVVISDGQRYCIGCGAPV